MRQNQQSHLDSKRTINLGSYYTPQKFVSKCYQFLQEEIKNFNEYSLIDTSFGYGNFLSHNFLKGKNF